jgi:hypothetical protein
MASRRDSVEFTAERTYTVQRPKFTLFRNVEYLDAAKLSRGSHTIEVGRLDGGCCDAAVLANVTNGMITGIEFPKCENATDIPPKFKKLLGPARKELARRGRVKWEDIPVQELTSSRAARNRLIIVITGIDDCYEICTIMSNGTKICFICCPDLGWCIGPSDPQVALF